MSEKYFLVGIGSDGVELIYDMTDENPRGEAALMRELTNTPPPSSPMSGLLLRCRLNSHRNIRLYAFMADNEISEDSLWEMANIDLDAFEKMIDRLSVKIGY